MKRGLETLAALAILLGAVHFFADGSADRSVKASATDTAAFRAQLAGYVGEMEGALSLGFALAEERGLAAAFAPQVRSLTQQCSAVRDLLAVEPSPEEARMWNEMERLLSFNRAWWDTPSTLRRVLEEELSDETRESPAVGGSPNDDCSASINPIAIQITKGLVIIGNQIADIVPDDLVISAFSIPFPVKIIVVTARAIVEVIVLTLETIDGLRTSCLREKQLTILDKLDVMDGKLDEILMNLGSMERLQIEEDLTRAGNNRIGILELPEFHSVGEIAGKLALVRAIVAATLREFRNAGQMQNRADARESFLRGEYWLELGEYKEAYSQYRAAYQAAVSK